MLRIGTSRREPMAVSFLQLLQQITAQSRLSQRTRE
jgi:hypothetical protein